MQVEPLDTPLHYIGPSTVVKFGASGSESCSKRLDPVLGRELVRAASACFFLPQPLFVVAVACCALCVVRCVLLLMLSLLPIFQTVRCLGASKRIHLAASSWIKITASRGYKYSSTQELYLRQRRYCTTTTTATFLALLEIPLARAEYSSHIAGD